MTDKSLDNQTKTKVAVIGLGWVACHRHIPAMRRNDNFEIIGLIDHHENRAKVMAKKLSVPNHATLKDPESLDDVEWFKDVEAVVIATPPAMHAPFVMKAMMSGKDVMVEKPFAMTNNEGRRAVQLAEKTKRILAITHNFQFARATQRLEKDLAEDRFGKIRRIAASQHGNPQRRLPSWYQSLPMGLFYDESPHFFYLLRRLAGEKLTLEKAHAVAMPEGGATPSLIELLYRSDKKIPVTISCQFDSALSEWFVMVVGEKGVGIIDIFRDIYIFLPNDKTHALFNIVKTSLKAVSQHLWPYVPNGWAFLRGRLDYGNDELYARWARALYTRDEKMIEGMGAKDALAVLNLQQEAIDALAANMVT